MDNQGGDFEYGADAVKYPRLRALVSWFKVYAYLCFGAALVLPLFLLGSADNGMEETMAWTSFPVIAVACIAQGFFFLMLAEVPAVFMDTEQNTRAILAHLEQEARQRRAANDAKGSSAAAAARTADLSSRVPKLPAP